MAITRNPTLGVGIAAGSPGPRSISHPQGAKVRSSQVSFADGRPIPAAGVSPAPPDPTEDIRMPDEDRIKILEETIQRLRERLETVSELICNERGV
jgi:hypothetical protein